MSDTPYDPVEETWNRAYPKRRKWNQIDAEARDEWRRVFRIYDQVSNFGQAKVSYEEHIRTTPNRET